MLGIRCVHFYKCIRNFLWIGRFYRYVPTDVGILVGAPAPQRLPWSLVILPPRVAAADNGILLVPYSDLPTRETVSQFP